MKKEDLYKKLTETIYSEEELICMLLVVMEQVC